MADNRYGLDTAYFKKNFKILLRDLENYTPIEMEQALLKLANVASIDRTCMGMSADKEQEQ